MPRNHSNKNIFPNLKRSGLSGLLIEGHAPGAATRIRSFWRRRDIHSSSHYVCLDTTYRASGVRHFARLFVGFDEKGCAQVIIDLGTRSLPPFESSRLTEKKFLDFWRWFCGMEFAPVTRFRFHATATVPYKKSFNLPFNPTPKGDVFVDGIKFGFSQKHTLDFLAVEKTPSNIMVSLTTKPRFGPDPHRLNETFFDDVLSRATKAVRGLFDGKLLLGDH